MQRTTADNEARRMVLANLASGILKQAVVMNENAELYLITIINRMPLDYRQVFLEFPEVDSSRNTSIRNNAVYELASYELVKKTLAVLLNPNRQNMKMFVKCSGCIPSPFDVIIRSQYRHSFASERHNHNYEYYIQTLHKIMSSKIFTERAGARAKKRYSGYRNDIHTFAETRYHARYGITMSTLEKLHQAGITTNWQLYDFVYKGKHHDGYDFSVNEIHEIEGYIYSWVDEYFFIVQKM